MYERCINDQEREEIGGYLEPALVVQKEAYDYDEGEKKNGDRAGDGEGSQVKEKSGK
jgi:hypothetical protein